MSAAGYRWLTVREGEHGFLAPVFRGLGVPSLRIWVDSCHAETEFDRITCGGHIHALALVNGRPVAVAWADFRVHAASYDHVVSRRFAAFIRYAGHHRIPMIYVVNSAGISLRHGRKVFSDAFQLWPALLRFAERNTLLTCALGRCLGLAPVLFGLGHYRVAVSGMTQINLTGPQVIQTCFGDSPDFDRSAAAERFVERTDLVHETLPTTDAAIARFLEILSGAGPVAVADAAVPMDPTLEFLESVLDRRPLELVPGWSGGVRLFLGEFRDRRLGIFINPVPRREHMINSRCIEKYSAGLDLFARLGVPIVSFLDAPGMDPRFKESDANNIRKMLWVGEKIIRYPHGSLGVIWGRCYGGATTLVFPKIFGGARVVALRGARIGSMQEQVVSRLLEQSPRLLAQWRASLERQGPDLADLLEEGSLDAVVDLHELPDQLELFLSRLSAPSDGPPRVSFHGEDFEPDAVRVHVNGVSG